MNLKKKINFNYRFNYKQITLLTVIILAALIFLLPQAVSAQGPNWVTSLIGGIASGIASVLGWILSKLMGVLIYVAQYNSFIKSAAIINGWVIARDISNMFFVVILLIIAFATILRVENYSYKKWLPKLILMAILINFSKTICGLLIDLAQVVMLTFVNAFKDVAAGSLVDMLGITNWQSLQNIESVSAWEIAAAYVLSVIYVVIALITVAAMVGMLVMRIVMLWVYVVLSPFAYLLAAFPGGTQYSSMWWKDFTKNLIVGPVLAFFIWLSFTSLTSFNNDNVLSVDGTVTGAQDITCVLDSEGVCKYGTSDVMIKFIIAIAMLLGGMKVAQEIGGAAAGVAGKISSAGNKLAIGAAAGAGALAWMGAKRPARWGVDKLQQKGIVDLDVKRVWTGMQNTRKANQAKKYAEGQTAAQARMAEGGRMAGLLAMTANPGDAWNQVSTMKGFKQTLKGGKRMQANRDRATLEEKDKVKNLDQATFDNNFINANSQKRSDMYDDATILAEVARDDKLRAEGNITKIDKDIADEEAKGAYKDVAKIEELKNKKSEETTAMEEFAKEEKKQTDRMIFSGSNLNRNFSDKEKFEAKNKISEAKSDLEKTKKKVDANIPMAGNEARAAEQKLTKESMGKLEGIDDASELVRVLKGAISIHDKAMVKAVMLKLTKDGNDNEALTELGGSSDHHGLKNLMKQFSDSKSNNYAGFSQQEAFSLGSQVAEMNKATHHWAATSAYVMENGKWRETTQEEHDNIRDSESGKEQLQAFIRNNGRLAYGYEDKDGFHLDVGGVVKLQSINSEAGFKNMDTMNESAARYIYDALNKKGNEKLLAEFKSSPAGVTNGDNLYGKLEKRLGNISGKNISQKTSKAKELLS